MSRRPGLWLAGILGALVICHGANADNVDKRLTAKNLVAMCSESRGAPGDMFCAAFLFGLETGLIQGPGLMQLGGGCMAKIVSADKLVQIFKSYVEQNPDALEEDASAIALVAIGRAFPCPNAGIALPEQNAVDVCARRCSPAPSKLRGGPATTLPLATEACLRTCGEELGRTAR